MQPQLQFKEENLLLRSCCCLLVGLACSSADRNDAEKVKYLLSDCTSQAEGMPKGNIDGTGEDKGTAAQRKMPTVVYSTISYDTSIASVVQFKSTILFSALFVSY